MREEWRNLNGPWQFAFDPGDSGLERGLVHQELDGLIVVPFCPESELSGIGDPDFHPAVWYRRTVRVPAHWAGRRVLLHFGAVDHDATVWADGREVGRHSGGFTSFTVDLGDVAGAGNGDRNGNGEGDGGEVVIVVRARDTPHGPQARGKQSVEYANSACNYTRTTGIWQTVWMEPVADVHLRRPASPRTSARACSTSNCRSPPTVRGTGSGPRSATRTATPSYGPTYPRILISRPVWCWPSPPAGAGRGVRAIRISTRR